MSDTTTTLGPETPADWTAVPSPADALVLQNLLQMYGLLTDQGRRDELADLFTDDAEWDGNEFGFGRATGPTAIASLVAGHFDRSRPMVHLPGPAVLTTAASDEIHGVCWCLNTRWTGSELTPVLYFFYEDVFRRGNHGRWQFARRRLRRRFPNA